MLPAAAILPAKAGCRLHGQTIRDIYNTKLNQNPVIVKLSACTHKQQVHIKQHTKVEKLELDSHTRSAAQSLTHACAQREREREKERERDRDRERERERERERDRERERERERERQRDRERERESALVGCGLGVRSLNNSH